MNYPIEIIIGVSVLILVFLVVLIYSKRHQPTKHVTLSDDQLNQLYDALGQKENILSIHLEHQRLKVDLNDTKKVNPLLIKALDIPAFLTGKTVTLLIKTSPKGVQTYLENKRKEAK